MEQSNRKSVQGLAPSFARASLAFPVQVWGVVVMTNRWNGEIVSHATIGQEMAERRGELQRDVRESQNVKSCGMRIVHEEKPIFAQDGVSCFHFLCYSFPRPARR